MVEVKHRNSGNSEDIDIKEIVKKIKDYVKDGLK